VLFRATFKALCGKKYWGSLDSNLEVNVDMFIYLLTAIGLTPGGSSMVHIYIKKYREQHKKFGKSAARSLFLRIIPWHLPYN